MNSPQKSKSLQEILKQRQQTTFVGREPQIALFRQNMGRSPELRDYFIFNVWGQGGVGKSTLLRQFRKIADEAEFATALTSDSETSVPEAMGRLGDQFEQSGHKLTQFSDRYKLYRQKKQELESDPDAPQGFSAFVGKSIAKAGLGLAKQVPGSGAVTPFIDEDAFTSQAGEWASYVAKKLGNKDEVQLVNEPVEVLTPLFVQELSHLAEKANLVLFFDTYERTSPFLDDWLRELLDGRHGDLPAKLILVIAGRDELDKNHWADYENFIARFPLNPFTDEEAIQYLHRKGITNDQIIETILHLSGRLPLLVTTLAATSPNDPTQIGDPSETAVERFLQWIDDPKKRQVAIDASLPRLLNRDIIVVLQGEDTADDLFHWLKSMPFVEQRPDGWAYHDIARTQMLRYKRRTSPQSWADIHGKLADYYDTQRTNLNCDQNTQWSDATWQVHTLSDLYHQLCQAPQAQLPKALNEFLAALKAKRNFAEEWADMMCRAGKDVDAAELSSWGKRLSDSVMVYNERNYESAIKAFTDLLNHDRLEPAWRPTAFRWRGHCHYQADQYEQALEDLTEAINLAPDEPSCWLGRGNVHRKMRLYEKALKDCNKAVELDPKDAFASIQRGQTYILMGRYKEAFRDFVYALEIEPTVNQCMSTKELNVNEAKKWFKLLDKLPDSTFDRLHNFPEDFLPISQSETREKATAIQIRSLLNYEPQKLCKLFELATDLEEKRFQQVIATINELLLDSEVLLSLQKIGKESLLCIRAISHQALGNEVAAKADLQEAIKLVQIQYNQNSENWNNTFNLALYLMLSNNYRQAKHFYQDGLNRGAPVEEIQIALGDLETVLKVFPGHQAVQAFKQGLEKRIKGQEND